METFDRGASGAVMECVHRRFADADADLANGFAEHATMGAEAMLALGLEPGPVLTWSEQHEPTHTPDGSTGRQLRDSTAEELTGADWTVVLRDHVDRFVGRLDVHLFHGLIRTAHAVRALEYHDSPEGRRELAVGIAAWTVWAGNDHPQPESLSTPDPIAQLLEMARRGATAYAAAPSIFTLHAVTAPMAFLLMAEHLMAEHLAADMHVVAASVFARTHRRYTAQPSHVDDRPFPSTTALSVLTHHWDAHPAKLVEAARRGHALTGDGVYLDAAMTVLR